MLAAIQNKTSNKKTRGFIILLCAFFILAAFSEYLPSWLFRLPDTFILPVSEWINSVFLYIQDDFIQISFYNEEFEEEEYITLIMVITRSISSVIEFIVDVIRNILLGGNKGFGLSALPWTVVAIIAFVVGYALKGWRLSLLAGLSVVYLSLFGQWQESMQTLSLILTVVPISLLLGLSFGVWAYSSRVVELILTPLLNVAQSLPHFSYLIPVVVFFGIGDHAGAIATIVFATPPMIRLTLLGLKKVPKETIEAGKMSGCSSSQLLFRVLIPSARQNIMIGVNQVIMQSLAMVVIASFIGASGLGYKLLVMLNNLKIGAALELGVSIVLIAVVLDRLSISWVYKKPSYQANLAFHIRYKYLIIVITLSLLSMLVSHFVPSFYFISPDSGITTASFWNSIIDWVVVNWFEHLQYFRAFLLMNVLIPMREAYLALPITAVFLLFVGSAYLLGGVRSGVIVFAFLAFIALTGWWDKAMVTAYMVSFSVLVAVILGVTMGIIASRSEGKSNFMLLVCDTFQTFPSFVYLIPVIMLFQVNDVSVIFAVIIYATIPATRYTIEGLRNIPQDLQEAATMSGVSKAQRLFAIELPLAFPHILIGINQTVIFSLFMVIIGAFIGTQDLGQDIMQALSESDMGKGLVLGLCVAFMGLVIDHMVNLWALKRKRELGL